MSGGRGNILACYLGHKGESGFVLGTACSIYNVNHCLSTVQTCHTPQPTDNACIYCGHRAMV